MHTPVPFPDPATLNDIAIRSFETATKRAAEENDALGIPTPVGVEDHDFVLYLKPGERQEYVGTRVRTSHPSPDDVPDDFCTAPWIWIVAGPNGAGKTTFTREFLNNLGQGVLLSLNADDRTRELLPRYPDASLPEVNLMAARQIDAEVTECIRSGRSFLVETVLSTGKYRDDLLEAKSRGFRYGFVYISIEPADLSPARVRVRVLKGGHDVDPKKAVDRWHRSHEQSIWFAEQRPDVFMFFDNSSRVL